MEIKVSLEDIYTDYGDTLASVIRSEIDGAIRTEVRLTIKKIIKEHLVSVQKAIEAEIKRTTPARLEKLLAALEKANNA